MNTPGAQFTFDYKHRKQQKHIFLNITTLNGKHWKKNVSLGVKGDKVQ